MRRTRSSFPILVSLTLLLAACTTPASSPSADDSEGPAASGGGTATGGTVRIGWAGYPDSLNPGNGVLSEAYTLYELVYDTPISVNSAGEYVPELATEWSSSEDGLTWTMTIRDDAVFQDGEPLTAEDVAFSMNLYKRNGRLPVPALVRRAVHEHRGHGRDDRDAHDGRPDRELRAVDGVHLRPPRSTSGRRSRIRSSSATMR